MKYRICLALVVLIMMSNQVQTHSAPAALPVYPNTINVLFVNKDKDGDPILVNGAYQVIGGPTAIPFEADYLPNVVHKEMGDAALTSAKEVQAIAARGFAWQKIAYGDNPPT